MIETTSTPTLWLKGGATAAKWTLGLLAVAWSVLAIVWVGLHFVIVPRIADFRPALEQHASRAVGLNVRIGDVAVHSNGLIPSLELSQVVIDGAKGQEVLRLPRVLVSLSARSIFRMGIEQLYVDGPVLDVRRTVDGRFWIAGLPVSASGSADGALTDWLFSQPEVAIAQGTVHWTDELRGLPTVTLSKVDGVLRNRLFSHSARLDANPPADWGDRFTIAGIFKEPLLSRNASAVENWSGQAYVTFPQVDVGKLRRYVDVGVDVAEGMGALRAWADIDRAHVTSATADVAMTDVAAKFDAALENMAFHRISGRIGAKLLDGGFELSTEGLQFDTRDGIRWPGGNVRFGQYAADAKQPKRGHLQADKLDLAALQQIATRLPLEPEVHNALKEFAPRGLVEQVQATWSMPQQGTVQYSAKGRVAGLSSFGVDRTGLTVPGVQGLDMDFDVNREGGKASFSLNKGSIDAVGLFDEPVIALDQLRGDVSWKNEASGTSVNVSKLRFENVDVQGELQAKWRSGPAGSPGHLDLQASLARASGNRVYRYLPVGLDKEVRDYLKDAIQTGVASNVKFKVKGNLNDFPFIDAKTGELRVSAALQNATYTYAPSSILPKASLPWPALTQLSADLLIDKNTLTIKGGKAKLAGLQVNRADATINNLYTDATLQVVADARGPLAEGFALVNGSPLHDITDKLLHHATASGQADYKVKLAFPIAAIEKIAVQGAVTLSGNDVAIAPDIPAMTRTRGVVSFTETGFTVTGGQARALGGDVKIEGGMTVSQSPQSSGRVAPAVLRVQGTATAEGLRQAKELGFPARLATYANGSSAYSATIGLRSGVPELLITTNLVGMALSLPAPFAKPAETPLAFRLDMAAVRGSLVPGADGVVRPQDQLQVDIGKLASLVYVRDVSVTPAKVVRGAIGVGLAADEAAPLPAQGVLANLNLNSLDVDAWMKALSGASGAVLTPGTTAPATAGADANPAMAYLPTSIAVRAKELSVGERSFNQVVVGGARDGLTWRANVDATELSGYLEYRQPSGNNAGRVYARLARLIVGPSTAQDVENILDDQPNSIPALDVVIDDFELRGKRLGRLEIDAVNMGTAVNREASREWRLNRFNIVTPEAALTATGNWALVNPATAGASARSIKDRRRTVLNFKLDISDSGDLLNRFGMPGVVRNGRGKMEGQVAWLGSPITLDYPSMSGAFHVHIETGQFLKADPGIAKLLGVLSLQSLPRRLVLDFRDVFSEGFAFDFLRGDIVIEQGIAKTANLQMKGVNAAVMMDGQADIAKETQSVRVIVIPEINAGSASVIASILNPLVGLTTFLAQVVLRRPLIDAATQEFFVDGTWLDPRVTKVNRNAPTP